VTEPIHHPRVRLERLIAVARLVVAAGTFAAAAVTPQLGSPGVVLYLAVLYFGYALAIVGLVWSPVRFAPGWDYAVHGFDLAALTALLIAARGVTVPFVGMRAFLLVCGMVRWQVAGILWTAIAVLVVAGIGSWGFSSGQLAFPGGTFAAESLTLTVVAFVLVCLTLYQHGYQLEIRRLATWPRTVTHDQASVLQEIISRAGAMIGAKRVLLVWRETDVETVNLAWGNGEQFEWVTEDTSAADLVAHELAGRTFQARDARRPRGRVVVLTSRGFRRLYLRPVSDAFAARFSMRTVLSSPLHGELVEGRMYLLDQPRPHFDDLLFVEVTARLAAVRLDGLAIIRQLRDNAALKERIRVARDLHDSLLQSQAGAAMQLMAARRQLDRDPDEAKASLDVVQRQLERSELDLRSFIRSLRPPTSDATPIAPLLDRLEELERRVEEEWDVAIEVSFDAVVNGIESTLSEQVYRLVQEGIVNAVRHASPSVVRVHVSRVAPGVLTVRVSNDGRGFPFVGTYNLAMLDAMNRGPRSLRERVTELNGGMTLTSTDTGSDLLITLPLPRA
jgi:signal transduction histidine kinase